MNALQAMDDPALFGPYFKGSSWDAWRAFLAALHGLPLTDAQLATYQRHTSRTDAPAEPFAEAALICGRRGGKSRTLALLGTCLASLRDYRPFLAPGEVATVAILASDRKQARSIFRFVKGMLDAVPSLKREITKETEEVIELGSRRVAIEITTASFRAARGYTYIAVLADEIAFWRSEESANPDEEILAAIRPGLATIPGSMLLLANSPYSKRGALYKTFRRHYGQNGARVLVWKASTLEMNPRLDPRIIAEAYEDDPSAPRRNKAVSSATISARSSTARLSKPALSLVAMSARRPGTPTTASPTRPAARPTTSPSPSPTARTTRRCWTACARSRRRSRLTTRRKRWPIP